MRFQSLLSLQPQSLAGKPLKTRLLGIIHMQTTFMTVRNALSGRHGLLPQRTGAAARRPRFAPLPIILLAAQEIASCLQTDCKLHVLGASAYAILTKSSKRSMMPTRRSGLVAMMMGCRHSTTEQCPVRRQSLQLLLPQNLRL